MQLPLMKPPPFCPAPFGLRQYVVALQNKAGELSALQHVNEDTWKQLTPLIQIVGPKDRPKLLTRSRVAEWVKKLASTIGHHPVFLDTLRLPSTSAVDLGGGTKPVLEFIHDECRKRGLNFVPVIPVGLSRPQQLGTIADAISQDGRGVCLRYSVRGGMLPVGYTLARLLTETLERVAATVEEADLILDLGFLDPDDTPSFDLAPLIEASVAAGDWRTLILLGTSMPATLGRIHEGTLGSLPRHEWQLWQGLKNIDVARLPTFGDYGIQHPDPPEGGGPGMRANIRYTIEDATMIARGTGSVTHEGAAQYRDLCTQLVTIPQFEGREFTWGDRVLKDCADGTMPPGWQQMWRGAGTSHHLRFVCDQLMSC